MKNIEVAMEIIMNAGEARSLATEALGAAREGDFAAAEDLLKQSEAAMVKAHNTQTELLSKAAEGEEVEINIYMVHAQDHLMTAMVYKDLAQEIVELRKN